MEIVEEVGLITCERRVVDQRARPPSFGGKCQWDICPDEVHMEEEGLKVQVQAEEDRRNTRKRTR